MHGTPHNMCMEQPHGSTMKLGDMHGKASWLYVAALGVAAAPAAVAGALAVVLALDLQP